MASRYDRYEALQVEQDGTRLTIKLGAPPAFTMTPQAHRELSEIFTDVGRDDSVRAVVLTGEGRMFCAGGDINKMVSDVREKDFSGWVRSMREARAILMGMLDLDKPVIAMVNGHAMGLGATLAVFSDIAVMSSKAKLGDPHVQIGLAAGDGGALMWPLLMGYARAKRYLLTGEPLTAAQCLDFGLVSEVAEPDDLAAAVDAVIDRFASISPLAVATTKRAVNIPLLREVVGSLDAHLGLETYCKIGPEHLEAALAAVEKRKANFD